MDAPIIPPKSELELRQCWLKEAFDRRTKAAAAADRINNGSNARRHVRPYQCGCGAWHIGGARKNSWRNSR